jgi:hypothetical protein
LNTRVMVDECGEFVCAHNVTLSDLSLASTSRLSPKTPAQPFQDLKTARGDRPHSAHPRFRVGGAQPFAPNPRLRTKQARLVLPGEHRDSQTGTGRLGNGGT